MPKVSKRQLRARKAAMAKASQNRPVKEAEKTGDLQPTHSATQPPESPPPHTPRHAPQPSTSSAALPVHMLSTASLLPFHLSTCATPALVHLPSTSSAAPLVHLPSTATPTPVELPTSPKFRPVQLPQVQAKVDSLTVILKKTNLHDLVKGLIYEVCGRAVTLTLVDRSLCSELRRHCKCHGDTLTIRHGCYTCLCPPPPLTRPTSLWFITPWSPTRASSGLTCVRGCWSVPLLAPA